MPIAELRTTFTSAGLDLSTLQDMSPAESTLKIYSLVVPGAQALSTWKKIRAAVDETGYWPVVAGSIAEFKGRDISALLRKLHDIPNFIERGHGISVNDWFDKAMSRIDFREQAVPPEVGMAMHAALKEYTDNPTPAGLRKFENQAKEAGVDPDGWLGGEYTCSHCPEIKVKPNTADDLIGYKNILTNNPYDQVVILLVPTKTPWEVPVYLMIGYGNQLHEPHEHFAVHKYWHENYGAEIITSTNDTIEMLVARPPTSPEEAQKLAQQQFVYAPDIVKHGTGKTSTLAEQLINGQTWYFWWD